MARLGRLESGLRQCQHHGNCIVFNIGGNKYRLVTRVLYESVTYSGQGMRFDDATIRASGAIEVASTWMEKTCLPELAGATSLMGCTVEDLRRVLATLYVYSLFVTKLEDVSDDQPTLGVTLQSCVVARRRDHMIEWLADLSGVPARDVEAIVSVLTFDPTHPHVTLAQQPLKYSTPPFGPADVHRRGEEFEKWKVRMGEYVTSFQNNPEVLGQHAQWARQGRATVFGLILVRWPLPIPVDFPGRVGSVDWPSLRDHILKVHPSSLRELMTWVDNRPDVTVPAALAWTAKDVQVGDRYSVLTPLPRERVFDLTQELAYRLWEARGRPLWDDQRDWFDAERNLAANPHVSAGDEI